jgi:hypothetical protein
LLRSHQSQYKLHEDLASKEDDLYIMKRKYSAVTEAWVKTTGLKVPSYRTAIEEEEEGPDSLLQDRKRYRQSQRRKQQEQQLPDTDIEQTDKAKPDWGVFNPADFTSSQEEALQEETSKRELSPVRQQKPILRRDSESERALQKLSGKGKGKVFPPPPVLNLGGIMFGGARNSAVFSSPQRQSTTAVASTSGTSRHSDAPVAASPVTQASPQADALVPQSNQIQPAPLPVEPVRTTGTTNNPRASQNHPSAVVRYHLNEHQERCRVIRESQVEDEEWVALAFERDAEMRQDKEDLRKREIERAIEVQEETGVDLGWGADLPREQRYRVVRVGEQQTAPLLPEPPVSNEIIIKEEEVDAELEGSQQPEEHILDEEIQVYDEPLPDIAEQTQGNHQHRDPESEYSFYGTPVVKTNTHKETTTDAASQRSGSSQSKKAKFGERDLDDDSESLSSLTSEESIPSPKKRKISKRQAVDEREFTEDVSVEPKKRSAAPAANTRAAKQAAAARVKRGANAVEPGDGERTDDDEIAMESEVCLFSP